MFSGIYTYNIDGKGRIVMPSRFLERLGNPFVLAGCPGGNLIAVSRPEMLPGATAAHGYVECSIRDRTGRFVIPSALREFAELHQTGEATVIGKGDEVEIWNKRRWEFQAQSERPSSIRSEVSSGYAPLLDFSPTPVTSAIIRQKALYGQPFFEVEGMLTVSDTGRIITRLETALRGKPRTIFLDLRGVETIDAAFFMAMEPLIAQLATYAGRMAVLTDRMDVAALVERLCGLKYVRVFRNLESGLWWLVDEGHA